VKRRRFLGRGQHLHLQAPFLEEARDTCSAQAGMNTTSLAKWPTSMMAKSAQGPAPPGDA
jgi:hypothetical protein